LEDGFRGWLGRKLLARLARWPIWASNPDVIQLSKEYNYIFFFASCPKQSRVKIGIFMDFHKRSLNNKFKAIH